MITQFRDNLQREPHAIKMRAIAMPEQMWMDRFRDLRAILPDSNTVSLYKALDISHRRFALEKDVNAPLLQK